MKRTIIWLTVILLLGTALGCRGRGSQAGSNKSLKEPVVGKGAKSGEDEDQYDVWKPCPEKDFHTWTKYSPDGKLQVSVAILGGEGRLSSASQIRVHSTDPTVPDLVRSWGHDGPGGAAEPVFTHVFVVDENVYLLLGWTAFEITNIELTAWLVKIENHKMYIGPILFQRADGEHRFVLTADAGHLGLFFPDEEYPGCWAHVLGRPLADNELRPASHPAPSRFGFWYTRGGLMGIEPPPGRVYWIPLKKVAAEMQWVPPEDLDIWRQR